MVAVVDLPCFRRRRFSIATSSLLPSRLLNSLPSIVVDSTASRISALSRLLGFPARNQVAGTRCARRHLVGNDEWYVPRRTSGERRARQETTGNYAVTAPATRLQQHSSLCELPVPLASLPGTCNGMYVHVPHILSTWFRHVKIINSQASCEKHASRSGLKNSIQNIVFMTEKILPTHFIIFV